MRNVPTISEAVELELQVRRQESALQQLRGEYAARLRRRAQLEAQLRERQANSAAAALRKKTEAIRAEIAQRKLEGERAAMAAQDELSQRMRVLEKKNVEIEGLEGKMRDIQETFRPLSARRSPRRSAQGPDGDRPASSQPSTTTMVSSGLDQQQEKAQQIVEMRECWGTQVTLIDDMSQDLRSVLDFMMRSNIVSSGGPSRLLTVAHVFPAELAQRLHLSAHGQSIAGVLLQKYEACIREVAAADAAQANAATPPAAHVALRPSALQRSSSNLPLARRPPQEHVQQLQFPTMLFRDTSKQITATRCESRQLRQGLHAEMAVVAEALGATLRSPRRRQPSLDSGRRELLRAAAWGDRGRMQCLLESLPPEQPGDRDEALLGWTAWHSAAAHGQVGALEVLKDHMVELGMHHYVVLSQVTDSGLPPLAIACIRGHVDAVASLIRGMAPVGQELQGGRHPLFYASAARRKEERDFITHQLVEASADPAGAAGPRIEEDVSPEPWALFGGCEPPAVHLSCSPQPRRRALTAELQDTGNSPGDKNSVGSEQSAQSDGSGRAVARPKRKAQRSPRREPQAMRPVDPQPGVVPSWLKIPPRESKRIEEPCPTYRAAGEEEEDDGPGFFAKAWSWIGAPIRDSLSFMSNETARMLARLTDAEVSDGVWSGWSYNFSHICLQVTLRHPDTVETESLRRHNKHATVITRDRLLMFKAARCQNFEVAKCQLAFEAELSEIRQVRTFEMSQSLLVLRMFRRPDVVLDVPNRKRFVDELQYGAKAQAARRQATQAARQHWSMRFRGNVQHVSESQAVGSLCDETGEAMSTLVFLDTNVFILLQRPAESLLVSCPEAKVFSFLDVQQVLDGNRGKRWRRYFCILMDCRKTKKEFQIAMLNHPSDPGCAAMVKVVASTEFWPMVSTDGDPCIRVEAAGKPPLTLRAVSFQQRYRWLAALGTAEAPGGDVETAA